MADALSRKAVSMGSLAYLNAIKHPFSREIQTLTNKFVGLEATEREGILASIEARYIFLDQIKVKQFEDAKFSNIHDKVCRARQKRPFLMVIVCCKLRGEFVYPMLMT